jgi:hypothetical protein
MRPSFRVGLFASSFGAFALLCASAEAQPQQPQQAQQPQPRGPRDKSNSQFTLRHEGGGAAEGQAARGRARAGDCAGALPSFDAALRSGIDPTLRRDRGLCHEQLGNRFPAIDDYRFYLDAKPEAPDAEQIRQRLAALEGQARAGGSASAQESDSPSETGARGEASASVSIGGGGGKASARSSSSELGSKPGDRGRDYDYLVQQEQLSDAAADSPLRNGTGFIIGPFVQLPRFFLGEGARKTLAYAVGAAFRYSTGSTVSLISELGFSGVGESGAATSQGGVLLMGGVELRFPVSKFAGDHLLLRGGFGYERNVVSGTRTIIDNLIGRFAFGYRHVFGSSLGLEALADGGPVLVIPESSDSRVNGVIGLNVAFVVGF